MLHLFDNIYIQSIDLFEQKQNTLILPDLRQAHPISKYINVKMEEIDSFDKILAQQFQNSYTDFFNQLSLETKKTILLAGPQSFCNILYAFIYLNFKDKSHTNIIKILKLQQAHWYYKSLHWGKKANDLFDIVNDPFIKINSIDRNKILSQCTSPLKVNKLSSFYLVGNHKIKNINLNPILHKIIKRAWKAELEEINNFYLFTTNSAKLHIHDISWLEEKENLESFKVIYSKYILDRFGIQFVEKDFSFFLHLHNRDKSILFKNLLNQDLYNEKILHELYMELSPKLIALIKENENMQFMELE